MHRRAESAVRANAHTADQCSGASARATLVGRRRESSRRQTLIGIENLHAQRQIAASEFRHVLINLQRVQGLQHFPAIALDRLKDLQLYATLIAKDRTDREFLSVSLDINHPAFDFGNVGRVAGSEG
jgi:hypothetical protein